MAPSVLAIGLMSGTSQDGVDIALIDTDGEKISHFGATACRPYTQAERTTLRSATAAAANLTDRNARPGIVAAAEDLVNEAHAQAVQSFLDSNGLKPRELAAIGFHGQTLLHRPERRLTVQIGNGRVLAQRLGIPVVYDFRAADVAEGGQGAPLAPVFHQALVQQSGREAPVAVLNVGGVANVTFIDGEQLIACDTGPGNALLDDFLRLQTGQPLDVDGRHAAAGKVNTDMIARLMRHPFFELPPPKSLDRNDFRQWAGDALDGIGVDDGAATLTALTADFGGAHRAASAARAEDMDRRRRRRAQSDVDGNARAAPGAGARGIGACRRLVGRFTRGAGLRLSRGAQPARPADQLSRHHRRAAPADRRRAGEAVAAAIYRKITKTIQITINIATITAMRRSHVRVDQGSDP